MQPVRRGSSLRIEFNWPSIYCRNSFNQLIRIKPFFYFEGRVLIIEPTI